MLTTKSLCVFSTVLCIAPCDPEVTSRPAGLYAAGCPIDMVDEDGRTALYVAASTGYDEAVVWLLNMGAIHSLRQRTALCCMLQQPWAAWQPRLRYWTVWTIDTMSCASCRP